MLDIVLILESVKKYDNTTYQKALEMLGMFQDWETKLLPDAKKRGKRK